MASSRTQREYKALLRDDKYVSPPVTPQPGVAKFIKLMPQPGCPDPNTAFQQWK